MLFKALRQSRGYGKFTRNRWAMISLSIISVYFAIAAVIIGVEAVQWTGTTAAVWVKRQWASAKDLADPESSTNKPLWNLRGVPIVNLLLAETASERVGPKWIAGFGIKQDLLRRTDQADFVFKVVDQAMGKLGAELAVNPKLGAIDARAILDKEEYRLAERRFADLPINELQSLHAEAKGLFSQLDAGKRQGGLFDKFAKPLETIRTQLAELGTTKDRATAHDELSHAIDDLYGYIGDFAKSAGKDHPISKLDLDELDKLRELAAKESTTSAQLKGLDVYVQTITDASKAAGSTIKLPPESSVAQIEGVLQKLMPLPTGLDGFIYQTKLVLGTDKAGRSIFVRSVYSAKTAIQVGLIVAIAAVMFGALVGSAAGYFGGIVDALVTWLYSTLSALPQLVLLAVITFMFLDSPLKGTLIPVYIALTLTFWIGTARVVRGEVLKIKELEYVQAGKAIGFSRMYILLRHVLPNTLHILFINMSLLFIGAIKAEVILTFLGLGVQDGASWGRMISDAGADEVINSFFWQIGAATVFMLILVLAFNVLSDALQDAFDPKHVG